ncbi:hypothetical protein [Flavobacterium sp.]|uniref:hypothetical protein n=1 Tax=Flavobacterium sp. TaxID=239 RepID=UPI002FDA94C5
MKALLLFCLLTISSSAWTQASFAKGSYQLLDGTSKDGYIESKDWSKPFTTIRFKIDVNANPVTIPVEQLKALLVSPHIRFTRKEVWYQPEFSNGSTGLNYTQKKTVFLREIGIGTVSLYTYFAGNEERFVYQMDSKKCMEWVPPSEGKFSTTSIDFKTQIQREWNPSRYKPEDLMKLQYHWDALVDFVRNYNYPRVENSNISIASEEIAVRVDDSFEEADNTNIPYAVVEQPPVFPGCESEKGEPGLQTCFSEQLNLFFKTHFKCPKSVANTEVKKIFVTFTIASDGRVTYQLLRNSNPELAAELQRIFAKLPQLKPGMMRKKPVSVVYTQAFTLTP